LIQSFHAVSTTAIEAIGDSDDAAEIESLIAKSLALFQAQAGIAVASDFFGDLLNHCLRAFVVASDRPAVIHMKARIAKLIADLTTWGLKDPDKLSGATDRTSGAAAAFAARYRAEVAPVMVQAVVRALELPQDFRLSGRLLDLLATFAYHRFGVEGFVTPDFITHVLIPSATLSAEEVDDASTNVDQYLGFCMDFDNDDEVQTPRVGCVSVVRSLVTRVGIGHHLYPFFVQPAAGFADFEARLFLLIAYIKNSKSAVREARKKQLAGLKKRQRRGVKKSFPPILPDVGQDVVQSVISTLQRGDSNPIFLQVAVLWLLASVLVHTGPAPGFGIAVSVLMAASEPIVILSAAKLFHACWPHPEDTPNFDAPRSFLSF
jgi:hypothetical protein